MQLEPAYLAHYLVGAVTVAAWWGAFLQVKGSPRHRLFGRIFLVGLATVLASVGGIFFLTSRAFAPPEVVEFTYLTLCVVTVAGTAFAAIRLKHDPERFRGWPFRLLGGAAFLMGGLVLAVGLATRSPMPVLFSVIGLLYGGAMLRFAVHRGPLHRNWWLGWHLNGMCFLFNAVHGTLLAVIWKATFAPGAGDEVNLVTQIGTMAIALALRLHFGRRFDAPLRFGPGSQMHQTA